MHRYTTSLRFILLLSAVLVLSHLLLTRPAPAADPVQNQEKRSCIQAVDGFAYLSENMTLAETRSAAFANAKRQALESARTYIHAKTQVTNAVVDYDTVFADSQGSVTVLEQKDHGIEDNNRYHVWVKAEVEYSLKPKTGKAEPAAAPGNKEQKATPAAMQFKGPNAPLSVKVWTPKQTYRQGEKIEVFIQGNRDFYAKIVDVTSSGDIIQLLPNSFRKTNFFKANEIYKIPNKEDQFDLTVAPPFGEDKIIAYVSELPLGEAPLEPVGKGLNQYRGTEKDLGIQTRGIQLTAKKAPAADRQSTPEKEKRVEAKQSPQTDSAEFLETSWVVRTQP